MSKIIECPNGSFMRAAHIVSVSPLFESVELGTDAFAVYTVGSDEPFLFCAPECKKTKDRKAHTAALHEAFLFAWLGALGEPTPERNN